MNERTPRWDEIKGIIERVDEICRESERARNRADDAMRRRPVWPDPGPTETHDEKIETPPEKIDDEKP